MIIILPLPPRCPLPATARQAAHANGKEGTMTAEEYMTEFSM
jgi:hypothetical protein